MTPIFSDSAYTIFSSFGTSVFEGSLASGQGKGSSLQFSIAQSNPTYRSFYWQVEPISGQFQDFWDDMSNIIGGSPAQRETSGFGTAPGAFPFGIFLNADNWSRGTRSSGSPSTSM